MAPQLAIFDFDDTLYRGQSFDKYIKFVYERERNFLRKLLYKLSKIFIHFTRFSSKNNKFILTRFMSGLPIERLQSLAEEFVTCDIQTRIIAPVYGYLQNHLQKGDTVIVVSGGLEIYIQIFAKQHNLEYSIATKIIDNKGIFFSVGEECLGQTKIDRLSLMVNINEFDIINSHVYSDHLSDLPLFEYFGNPHYVAHSTALIPDIVMKKNWDIIRYE
ncbi:MAG: HAD-IB family hydrolase [Candidatus Kapabacteria bacterium]|nr:HAD-IB family hydrolase [Candidatus Kapabacteria bacterium]